MHVQVEFISTRFEHVYLCKVGIFEYYPVSKFIWKFSDSLELRIKWSFPYSNLDEYQVRYEIGNFNIDKFSVKK